MSYFKPDGLAVEVNGNDIKRALRALPRRNGAETLLGLPPGRFLHSEKISVVD
jgi:hypothetical protein